MLDSIITWAGASSADNGIKVERFPNLNRPIQKYEQVSVPGRNGDLFFYQDAWENYDQEYEIYAGEQTYGGAPSAWRDVFNWLNPAAAAPTVNDYINLTVNGYHQLIDSYESDTIRLATFCYDTSVANSWNRFGRAAIRFSCRPERFTSDAFTAITKSSTGGYVTNPSQMTAKPHIRINGSGTGTVTVNGYVMSITGLTDYIYVDCDTQNCYRLLAENKNSNVTLTSGFPVLTSGRNTISWTGGVTSVVIVPRWWRL